MQYTKLSKSIKKLIKQGKIGGDKKSKVMSLIINAFEESRENPNDAKEHEILGLAKEARIIGD